MNDIPYSETPWTPFEIMFTIVGMIVFCLLFWWFIGGFEKEEVQSPKRIRLVYDFRKQRFRKINY